MYVRDCAWSYLSNEMKLIIKLAFLAFCIAFVFAEECKDADREGKMGLCKGWKEDGLCKTEVEQMKKFCRKTCDLCGGGSKKPLPVPTCRDKTSECPQFVRWCKAEGRQGDNMRKNCPLTCGLCHRPTLPPGQTIPPHHGGCGKPDVQGTRVIAGKTAVRGSWPWQILMLFAGQPMCGGTLVSPRYVVTAAHCVYGRETSDQITIRVGEHDRDVWDGSEVDVRVIQVLRHDKYDPRRLNNDIAMLYLEKPVQFNKYVSPVCLPKSEVPPGSKCYITGWGKVQHPGVMTTVLQQGLLPVVSNDVCYKKNIQRLPTIPITKTMICAGSGGTKRLTGCHGDSGGPFVCEVNGVWELHGSVSFGSPSCESTEMYTVFSRTTYFLDWIKLVMAR